MEAKGEMVWTAPKEARIGRTAIGEEEAKAARRSEDDRRDLGMAEARATAGMMGEKRRRGREAKEESDIKGSQKTTGKAGLGSRRR